MFVLLRYKNNR